MRKTAFIELLSAILKHERLNDCYLSVALLVLNGALMPLCTIMPTPW